MRAPVGRRVEKFTRDFEASECYWSPLRLERCEGSTFLETTLVEYVGRPYGSALGYRLKNDNENGRKVWRYHHYWSQTAYGVKRNTLLAALRKVDNMASDHGQLFLSATAKLKEFKELGYPKGILKYMCGVLGARTGKPAWWSVRHRLE